MRLGRRQNSSIDTVLPIRPIGRFKATGPINERQAFLDDLGRPLGQISGDPGEANIFAPALTLHVVIQRSITNVFQGRPAFVIREFQKDAHSEVKSAY